MSVDPRKLRILLYPDPSLLRKASPIEHIDDNVRAVVERMIELMFEAPGVGLAAPQVGLSWRLFVTAHKGREGPIGVYINPKLRAVDTTIQVMEEGCLSLPGINADIRRQRGVLITALDQHGRAFTQEDHDFLARVWQHENDHLDGVLISDRMDQMDRLANRKALKELRLAAAS